MTSIDVIPLGRGRFLIQLFGVAAIPEQIGFGRYYEASCSITLADGTTVLQPGVLHRPRNIRNVTGARTTDWLVLLVVIDLSEMQLASATVSVSDYGVELSEREAELRYRLAAPA